MKTVQNYDKFSEDYRLNENLFKKAWGAIVSFFQKKYKQAAWAYYALFLKKTGQLPKEQVEIIPPGGYDEVPSEEEVKMATESLKNKFISISRGPVNYHLNEKDVDLASNDPNMRNVDVKELIEEVIDIYNMNLDRVEMGKPRTKNDALFIWGAPGIGKTEILNQVAKELDIWVQEWHLSQIEPTDFRGVPKIENIVPGSTNPDDERTVSKLPAIFPTDNGENGKGGIMFFDEINRAPKMVLSAALSLCLGGRIGTYELPSKWIVIAAGNRPEDIGGVATPIEPALANRFAHVNYAPTLENWMDWALTREDINPDLIAFLKFNKTYFHKLDPDKDNVMNWPSPRTWEMASHKDYYKRGKNWKNHIGREKLLNIYKPLVGGEAALNFVEYLDLKAFFNEKDVADVYAKGAKAKKPPTRLDQARAAAASIAFFKKGEKVTPQDLTNVLEFALSLPDVESRTSLIAFMKMVHPYVRDDEPYKKIYWDYVRKWHVELKGLDDASAIKGK